MYSMHWHSMYRLYKCDQQEDDNHGLCAITKMCRYCTRTDFTHTDKINGHRSHTILLQPVHETYSFQIQAANTVTATVFVITQVKKLILIQEDQRGSSNCRDTCKECITPFLVYKLSSVQYIQVYSKDTVVRIGLLFVFETQVLSKVHTSLHLNCHPIAIQLLFLAVAMKESPSLRPPPPLPDLRSLFRTKFQRPQKGISSTFWSTVEQFFSHAARAPEKAITLFSLEERRQFDANFPTKRENFLNHVATLILPWWPLAPFWCPTHCPKRILIDKRSQK